ncbi:hypothetical protein CCHR01_19224 [Colletotrichum chrysophilum]|uniref:Uncharacterized protein n=1 Tax=Colletotrichum chrysophilum TaxID=1836956 RepID=A0AAD9E7E3_9PEZI|nr:hypothetical protein CCHR01_19224 [Colletotrichum chrysophilum]
MPPIAILPLDWLRGPMPAPTGTLNTGDQMDTCKPAMGKPPLEHTDRVSTLTQILCHGLIPSTPFRVFVMCFDNTTPTQPPPATIKLRHHQCVQTSRQSGWPVTSGLKPKRSSSQLSPGASSPSF